MIGQNPWTEVCEFIFSGMMRGFQELCDQWNVTLQQWLDDMLSGPIPDNWRSRLDQFVAETEEFGLEIEPDSIRTLEELIASHAEGGDKTDRREHEPALTAHEKPRDSFDAEGDFDRRLKSARRKLETLRQLLDVVGDKLDAAQLGGNVDVDSEVDMIGEYLRGYNEDLEAARDLWLRYGLAADDIGRLTEMLNPASLGLPRFADEEQGRRALRQTSEIGKRLGRRDAAWGAVETGLQTADTVGTVAVIAAGGGALYTAAKTGGKWAVVKLVAGTAAAAGAEYLAEKGLRAAGVSEQTIRGAKLAAAVVSFILLHKAAKRGGAPPAALEEEQPRVSGSSGKPPSSSPPSSTPTPPNAPPSGKPPLPPPRSAQRYTWAGHRTAAEAEEALARTVHSLPDEVVVHWGKPVPANGPDVISVNTKTGEVTLWDSKYRGSPRKIQPSSTFQGDRTRENAIRQAVEAIKTDTSLPPSIKRAALANLEDRRVRTRTVGAGNARNSTLR
jgi:hypothetical protein